MEVVEFTQSCGAQLTYKTNFYCEKLNSYEHLKFCGGICLQCPPGSAAYDHKYVYIYNYMYIANYVPILYS